MKRLSFLIALMIAANWSGPVRAEPDFNIYCRGDKIFYTKFTSYNEFSKLHENEQITIIQHWLAGYTSGISLGNLLCGERISSCMDSTSPEQQLAMLKKKAQDSPEKWGADHYTAWYMFKSFIEPCLKGEIPLKKKK